MSIDSLHIFVCRQNSPPFLVLVLRRKLVSFSNFCIAPEYYQVCLPVSPIVATLLYQCRKRWRWSIWSSSYLRDHLETNFGKLLKYKTKIISSFSLIHKFCIMILIVIYFCPSFCFGFSALIAIIGCWLLTAT